MTTKSTTAALLFSWLAAATFLLTPGQLAAAQDTRVMLLEEGPVGFVQREVGRIAGAVRIAVPETGGHIVVLTSGGEVWTWGDNTSGQLGTGDREPVEGWHRVEELNDVVAIAAGAQHTVALRADGTVWMWGETGAGVETRQVMGLREVLSVAAGERFTAALKADGTLWVWGAGRSRSR
jgi:alpha-tubulin suppressor-like RCC1 family protein